MPTHDNTPPDNGPWQVGDLALCVKGGPIIPGLTPPNEYPKAGTIGKVLSVVIAPFYVEDGTIENRLGLDVEGCPPNSYNVTYWPAARFIRIPPKAKDEEDEETIRQYNSKQKVTT